MKAHDSVRAEYGSSVWYNSSHIKKLDSQINAALRIVSGTLRPTPIACLPVLANIDPADICRRDHLIRDYNKFKNMIDSPICHQMHDLLVTRLRSRRSPWTVDPSRDLNPDWRERVVPHPKNI